MAKMRGTELGKLGVKLHITFSSNDTLENCEDAEASDFVKLATKPISVSQSQTGILINQLVGLCQRQENWQVVVSSNVGLD